MTKPRQKGRMKRAYLNRFTKATVNTGGDPNHPLSADARERAKSLAETDVFSRLMGLDDFGFNEPRLAALRRRAEELAKETDGCKHHIVVKPGNITRTVMFYTPKRTKVWFVNYDTVTSLVKVSAVFTDMDRAKLAFQLDRLSWVEAYSLPVLLRKRRSGSFPSS